MSLWAVIALAAGGFGVALWTGVAGLRGRRSKAIDEGWRALAARLELSPEPVPGVRHRFVGRFLGRPVEIFVARGGWAEVRTRIGAPMPAGLHLVHQRTAAILGLKQLRDVRVGASPFDDEVIVHSDHPAAAIRLLRDEPTRAAVHALLTSQPYTYVVGNDAIVHLPPTVDAALARDAVRKLCHAAEVLEEHSRELALEAASQREQVRLGHSPPPPLPERPALPSLTTEERRLLSRAATQRAVLLASGGVPLLVSTVALLGGELFRWVDPGSPVPGALRAYAFSGGAVGLLMLALSLPQYRCPGCRQKVVDEDGGPDLSAHACPRCGVRLR